MSKHNYSFLKKIIIALIVSVVFLAGIFMMIRPHTKHLDVSLFTIGDVTDYKEAYVEMDNEGVVSVEKLEVRPGEVNIRFKALKKGHTGVRVLIQHGDMELKDVYGTDVSVSRFKTAYTSDYYDFNGMKYFFYGIAVVHLAMGVFMFILFRQSRREAFFSYKSILSLGLSFYFIIQGLAFTAFSIFSRLKPEYAHGKYFVTFNGFALTGISLLSTPFILILSIMMSVSNISLIKHEGRRVTNLLGIFLSVLLLSGVLLILILFNTDPSYFGLNLANMGKTLSRGIVSALYVYLECNLLSTLILSLRAGRHVPDYDKDYIIILGCGIRDDGTLYPLLKGRADAAIKLYRDQLEATGKKAVFVPSGGQGSDECMPEGAAIRRYLLEQGIPEEQIMTEERSLNTHQNMLYSKELIDGRTPEANVAFATTNYHVFRGGMLAAGVGMNADGVGAKTKWYFWPNALIREFIGMIVKEWKMHLFLCILFVVQALTLGNIQWLLRFF